MSFIAGALVGLAVVAVIVGTMDNIFGQDFDIYTED